MNTSPIIDLIHCHASVRHYKPDPLPEGMVEKVVAAGQCASTSSNMQAYSVICITDPERRGRMAELATNDEFIRQAPVLLVWCADMARIDRACQLRGYTQITKYTESFLTAALDCTLAAQTAALAAESLGLGLCYIGALRNNLPEVIELLELPRLVVPLYGMTLGWPLKPAHIRPRLPLRSILHREKYDRTHEDEGLRLYDAAMLATGIYQGRQVPVPGKSGEMEDYSWTEHTARRVSKPVRTALRGVLEKQGFALK